MVIMAPSDENECRQMLHTGYHYQDDQVLFVTREARGQVHSYSL